MALVMGACTKGDGLSDQNAGKEKPTVTLEQTEATDFALHFVVTASMDASQFGYVVMAGHENEVPTPISILTNEVSKAQAGETFSVIGAEDIAPSQEVLLDCSGFETPSDKYQVFAVAITKDGLTSEIVKMDVTMNDKTAPVIVGAGAEGNVLQVAFDEEVVLGTGKATLSVIAWGLGDYAVQGQAVPQENLSVEVNVLTIVCPEMPAGAGYIVSLEEGVVKDLSGNPSAAIQSGYSNSQGYVGLGWDTDFVPIPITAESFQAPAEDVNWAAEDANLVFTLPTEVMPNSAVKNPISVVYQESAGVSQLYAEWVLAEDNKTVTVYLPKMPTGQFDVYVQQHAFMDVWGNTTTSWLPSELRYSNYLVDVKGGDYTVEYIYPDADGNAALGTFPVTIYKLDETSVMLAADWFNYAYSQTGSHDYTVDPYLYGEIDFANNQIVFDGTMIDPRTATLGENGFASAFFYYDAAKTMMLVFWGSGTSGQEPITMSFDEDGYLTTMSYCDYSIHKSTGEYVTTYGSTGVRGEGTYANVTYVPEATPEAVTANAPSMIKILEPISVEKVFTK